MQHARPLISFVVPMYNVARYLPPFLESLANQSADTSDIEIVFVDDGSTDDSAVIVERWLATANFDAKVIRQPNAGLSGARNSGMVQATGTWISFPDPDDLLSPDYVEVVRGFLTSAQARDVYLVSTNLQMLDDASGKVTNGHPLRAKFDRGQRVVDLNDDTDYIHMQAASAFYLLDSIRAAGLTFDHRVRPNFEDSHLTCYYLDSFDKPRVAVLPDAQYLYRQRSDGSSLVQGSWARPEKYDDLPRYGYLPVLRDLAAAHGGTAPRWAQTVVLYDLMWFFRNDNRPNSPTAGITAEQSSRFWELVREIVSYIDTDVIDSYSIVPINDDIRAAIVIAGKNERLRPPSASADIRDIGRGLVRVWYYFGGEPPAERWTADGGEVAAVYSKIRAVTFLGRTAMYQRIAWLPSDKTLQVEVDGTAVPLTLGGPRGKRFDVAAPADIAKHVRTIANPPGSAPRATFRKPFWVAGDALKMQLDRIAKRVRPAAVERGKRYGATALQQLARTPWMRKRFTDAWLLIDRDNQAQDNAERFYEYLRDEQPRVNAWFVLSRKSPDWDRLKNKGFKLIPHRTPIHAAAVQNCSHIISSQIDHYVVAPLPPVRFKPTFRYTFLQHGVTKDDLSVWINPKPIDLMLTVTPDEHASIVDDYTPYRYTDREIKMTGFPRHDRLLALAASRTPEQRRVVLVTPTWRRELLGENTGRGNQRQLRDDFWHSEYAQQWRAFLESEELHKIAEEHDWQVIFLPHPNMTNYLDDSPLDEHVHVRRYSEVDIQELVAGAGVLVTDYSSMAFEAAYLQRSVVYLQFDRAEFFNGSHAYRKGTWSYEDSGFGPVTEHVDDAVREVTTLMIRDGAPDELYAKRMAETFPLRDGLCSQRTYEAIRAIEPRKS